MIVTRSDDEAVLTTEDVLLSLCNSVTQVLSAATQSQVSFFRHGTADQQDLPQARYRLFCAV